MTVFIGTVTIVGQNGKGVKRTYDLGDFASGTPDGDYALADSAMDQIIGALGPVTDGALRISTLTGVHSQDLVTAGAGDVFENAMVNVYLDAAGEKVAQIYIPAPAQGIFLATDGKNRDVIDITDADLVQYVQQISQHVEISDGESVDTTLTNGIANGVRTLRKLKLG